MSVTLVDFPWNQIMQFGLGTLKLAPRDFWSLSVLELNAALRAYQWEADSRPSRRDIEQMMERYPDNQP